MNNNGFVCFKRFIVPLWRIHLIQNHPLYVTHVVLNELL